MNTGILKIHAYLNGMWLNLLWTPKYLFSVDSPHSTFLKKAREVLGNGWVNKSTYCANMDLSINSEHPDKNVCVWAHMLASPVLEGKGRWNHGVGWPVSLDKWWASMYDSVRKSVSWESGQEWWWDTPCFLWLHMWAWAYMGIHLYAPHPHMTHKNTYYTHTDIHTGKKDKPCKLTTFAQHDLSPDQCCRH